MSPSRPLFLLAVILAAIAAAQPAFGVGLPQPPPLAPVAGDPTQALPGKIKFDRSIPADSRRGAVAARVLADKAEFQKALEHPDEAFDAHVSALVAQAAALRRAGRRPPPHATVLENADAAGLEHYRETFKAALQEIAELNAASGSTVAYGVTPLTHLPREEFARLYLNGRKAQADSNRTAEAARAETYNCQGPTAWRSSGLAAIIPPSVIDWRRSKPPVVTSVKFQGECGSCVVFANTASLEAAFILKHSNLGYTNANTDLSEQDSMDCTPGDACVGANGYEYVDRAICYGVAYEKDDPYTERDTNQCSRTIDRFDAGIKGYTYVPGNVDDVRRALSHNVLSIGVGADTVAFQNYKSGVIGCSYSGSINHETAVVAYANNVNVVVNSRSEAWQVFTLKNSWADGWGESGFYRIRGDCPYPGALGVYSDDFITVPIRS